MSVRWKPLIILSGLFLVLGAVGFLALMAVILPKRAEDVLPIAREDVRSGRFEQAKIRYAQALQRDAKNPKIHLEIAEFLRTWSNQDSALKERLRPERLKALADAAKYGKQMAEPRRELLSDALQHEEWADSLHWAHDLLPLDSANADSQFVLAAEALEQQPVNEGEAKTHVQALEALEPERTRTHWLRARLAEQAGDSTTLEEILSTFRTSSPKESGQDALCRIKLRMIDVAHTKDQANLALRLEALGAETASISGDMPPAGISEITRVIEKAQRQINASPEAIQADPKIVELTNSLAEVADKTFQKACAGRKEQDLRPYQRYAEYLLYRNQRDRCLQVVEQALDLPSASQALWAPTVAELREIGIKSALADSSDPQRFDRAAPLIDALLSSSTPRYQALGHLFHGVIDLELSGSEQPGTESNTPQRDEARLASALLHLRSASEGLKDVPTAQALYGVALIQTGEKGIGRQHLQEAYRLGGSQLDPRYQVWAAWAVLQAGYPENAEPIAVRLLTDAGEGRVAANMVPTLHFLLAEIYQARPTIESRRLALGEYQAALKAGYPKTRAIELRVAQLESLIKGTSLASVPDVTDDAPSEMLAILALREKGDSKAARQRLNSARKRYPDNTELVALDAAIWQEADDAAKADEVLSSFLAGHPGNEDLLIFRAKLLAGPLKNPAEARSVLTALAGKSSTSSALIQLATLEIAEKNHEAAQKVILQIRERWTESAAPDLLEAQLALVEGKTGESITLLDEALRKDPQNKVALFWKARLQEETGSPVEARQILESILVEKPIKELEGGVPLVTAAQWALAAMAMDRQDYDTAVARFDELVRDHPSDQLTRPARWNLAMARSARGEVSRAKAEVAELLRDSKTTLEERVQAADFYRRQNDDTTAMKELDNVLAEDPNHGPAISLKALALTSQSQLPAAIKLVRSSISSGKAPAGLYLLLSGLENLNGPEGMKTALKVLEQGLEKHPASLDLIRAQYQLMTLAQDENVVSVLEKLVEADAKSPARDVLIDAYRDNRQFEKAIALLEEDLDQREPKSAAVSMARLIAVHIAQATEAGIRQDRIASAQAMEKANSRIAEAYNLFPGDSRFLELEGELALQTRDSGRAAQAAQQLTDREKGSAAGPILRARIAAMAGRPDEAARAYEEAVERSPARADFRLALGRAEMGAGRFDAALKQASTVIDSQNDMPAALVLKAQALVKMGGTPAEAKAKRQQAAELLSRAIKVDATNGDAYHLLSDLQAAAGARGQAISTLESCLKVLPNDETALSLMIQRLSESPGSGKPVDPASLARAEKVASSFAQRDKTGVFSLATAVGYHRAGLSDLAANWCERSAQTLDRPIVYQTLGDILLAQAESTTATEPDPKVLTRAVEQYDRVLSQQPDSLEVVNNKAWILHRYLGRHAEALETAESFAKRVDTAILLPDFLDTLGSIQVAVGKNREAEATFEDGLRKAPDHPVLNYHMAKLLAETSDDKDRAKVFLDRALKSREEMPPTLIQEMDQFSAKLSR